MAKSERPSSGHIIIPPWRNVSTTTLAIGRDVMIQSVV
jgi:hypothetical protein